MTDKQKIEFKKKYINMVIEHCFDKHYRLRINNAIINQRGYDFWHDLIYKLEVYKNDPLHQAPDSP